MNDKALTARETYQVLRDIALGVRAMRRLGSQSWAQIYCGLMTVEADGWVITFYNDCDTLDYCDSCYCPDGRVYVFDSFQRFGTGPIELLSTWEHAQLGRLLRIACTRIDQAEFNCVLRASSPSEQVISVRQLLDSKLTEHVEKILYISRFCDPTMLKTK